jgi:uncharacterized protein with HEPN domain
LHVRDAIQHILEYTAAGKESFLADRKTQDAVVRNLEIIGEATKCVSQSLKDAHPDISWKPIAGMRDKLIHDYFGINLQLVWDVVEPDLPALKLKVAQLLESLSKHP